jgi:hypothetical protein
MMQSSDACEAFGAEATFVIRNSADSRNDAIDKKEWQN